MDKKFLFNYLADALPAQWQMTHFRDAVYFQEGPGIRNWQYRDSGIPFVNIRCLVNGRLDRNSMNCLSIDEVNAKYLHFLLDAGDYVVSSSGTIGRIAVVHQSDLPCMLNTSVIRMRSKTKDLDPGYLRFFLESTMFQGQIESFAAGSVQLNYGPTHLKQMWIVLPPLKEQQAIAAVLGALDDKIAVNEQIASTTEQILRTSFEAVSSIAPGTIRIEELGVQVRDGVNPSALCGTERYVGLEHVPRKSMWLNSWGLASEVGSVKTAFRAGDVLFGKLRPYFHKVVLAPEDGVCSTDIIVVRAVKETVRTWLLMSLTSDEVVAHATARSDGTRMPRARWADLAGYEIAWPGDRAAEGLHSFGQDLVNRVQAASSESRCLAELRDALLPQLISGDLRIKDADRLVSDAV